MKALSLAGLGLLLLAACGGSPGWSYQRLARDPSGGDLVSVSCGGSQTLCYRGAADACPAGFDPVDSNGQAYTTPVRNLYTGQVIGTRHDYSGSLLVRCKPDGVAQVAAPPPEPEPTSCLLSGTACAVRGAFCCEGLTCVARDGVAACETSAPTAVVREPGF